MLSSLRPPEVAIDTLALRQSEVNAWVAGETVPRHYEQVDAVLRLGTGYQSLQLDVSGKLKALVTVSAKPEICLSLLDVLCVWLG